MGEQQCYAVGFTMLTDYISTYILSVKNQFAYSNSKQEQ